MTTFFRVVSPVSAEKPKLSVSGWGWLTMGQVQSTEPDQRATVVDFDQQWLTDIQAGIKVTAPVTSKSTCHVHIMCSLFSPIVHIAMGSDNAEPLQKKFTLSLLDVSVKTFWKTGINDTVLNEFGYFPVKYNPEAMNLGEYLFRSNAYPPLLTSGFEIADKVKMAGIHTGYRRLTPIGRLKADIYLNTETECYPTADLSLSALLGYTDPGKFLDLSMGVSFYHLVPFDQERITPAKNKSYTTIAASFIDSITGVKTDYTFRGTKLAAAVTFDPKVFFNSTIFGKNDLKIYGEFAILGVKNYPGWYENRKERWPVMAGVNWPTHQFASYCVLPEILAFILETNREKKRQKGIGFGTAGILTGIGSWLLDRKLETNSKLDLISIEIEHNPSPYMNSYHFIWKTNSPIPDFKTNTGMDYYSEWKKKHDDDWKWSVYTSKVIKNVRISGQIASDHTSKATYLPEGKRIYTEMVPRTEDWYFMLRCGFFF
jgi:hypothetical protein